MTADRQWSGRSHGGDLGHRLVHAVARLGGPLLCYLFIIPPTLWLFATLHPRRGASARYWRRMRPDLGRWGCQFMALRHFYSFARMLADRFLVSAAPGTIHHRSLGYDVLRQATANPHGCIMLSAHVGNWELTSRLMADYPLGKLNLVMLQGEDPRVAEQVRRALANPNLAIIDLADPFAASLGIAAALRQGETCCMLGDRTVGSGERTLAVPFCGGLARFPVGPFIAAATTGAVVMPTFAIKTGWNSYATVAFAPWTLRFTSRAQRQAELAAATARWARCVEVVIRRFPLQWHNFYDFWAP
jgi:predicted LPLAT superfamily acyltransferase